ncbi:MAG: 3,4-dihydroxy-2-butanone-4-phosphate synthase [Ahrensia sp.]|nr:3,4-dihydroxy-2-butanone-4-phosphate synthase [Ahrensia sp.]
MTYNQAKTVEAIRAFERGEMVVVMDDDGRENEGDLIVAAVHCTPEMMAMMVRHTSGIVCAPMTAADANRLNLQAMVANNTDAKGTAFTVSVDYKHGTTTGISADDRTVTVRNLANPNAGASDFNRPGHVFPLVAREGGVLMRSGHTEAAVDLCKLAGLPTVGVISELVNDDGTVMRGPQVEAFAREKGLKQVSVADLIAYRQRKETLVEHVDESRVRTRCGDAVAHTYRLPWDMMQHLAIVVGDIRDGQNIPVRLHLESVVDDVFGSTQEPVTILEEMVKKHRRGVVVYLREGSVGVAKNGDEGSGRGREHHAEAQARESEWREIGLGAQILKDLGISSIRLYASRERRYVGIEGFGIEISATEILES